jgi:hypothetical protein
VLCFGFVLIGVEFVEKTRFRFVIVAPLSVCILSEGSTDTPTGVSKAPLGRGRWIPLSSGAGFHQSGTHGMAKPGAKMGVPHSSTDPFRVRCGK